jgi:hypothetical protein
MNIAIFGAGFPLPAQSRTLLLVYVIEISFLKATFKIHPKEKNIEIMGHVLDVKTLLMNGLKGSPTILIPIVIRRIFSSRGKQDKHLTIETTRRLIVAEDLEHCPFSIMDGDGKPIYNCYLIEFRIWNKGKDVIRDQDISKSEHFILEISSGARVLGSPFLSRDPDNIGLSISELENGKFKIDFEFINADEWLEIGFYVTGNPNARVSASGRIAGQKSTGFDVSIDDGKASFGERLYSLCAIVHIILIPISLGIGITWLFLLLHDYPLQTLWSEPEHIPKTLVYLFIFGLSLPILYLIYFVLLWIARKRHPATYPLSVDCQPKAIENLLSYSGLFHSRQERSNASKVME